VAAAGRGRVKLECATVRLLGVIAVALTGLAAWPAAAASGPTPMSVVRKWMRRTVEVAPGRTVDFRPLGRRVTIGDGHGGSLTAVVGVRNPTADAYGQLIFFFHGRRFLDWDSDHENPQVAVRASGGAFAATYAHYRRSDPLCCPSLPNIRVRFRWTGQRLAPSRRPPRQDTRVRLR
jgi:LppP/LprE lipoprotein